MLKRNIVFNTEKIINALMKNLYVEKPCKVLAVKEHSKFVDVEYYDNNEPKILYNVPVKHIQSSRAFVFLGLSVGDRGTLRFFDSSVTEYLESLENKSRESRAHDINDGYFAVGFFPTQEQYNLLPQYGDIVIGTAEGATVEISGSDIVISGGNVNISSNVIIDGKPFLTHRHSTSGGSPTGGVI